ncbi:ATP-dependent DNA ligase [Rhizobium sp. RAF56]|uniref:ATP-dependent DNA ligase n=1 Tax=Rhizobium sp. RAF56 TaxID=3233062 RepID=UPI003F9BE08E
MLRRILCCRIPPKGDAWICEIKLDGYRRAVRVEPNKARILGPDWTDRLPTIADSARGLNRTMILDGEAVVLDEEGRPTSLQQALGGRGGKCRSGKAIFTSSTGFISMVAASPACHSLNVAGLLAPLRLYESPNGGNRVSRMGRRAPCVTPPSCVTDTK